MMLQLLVRLPEELVRRFRRAVAPRQRSKFIAQLLIRRYRRIRSARAIRCTRRLSRLNRTKLWRPRWRSGKRPRSMTVSRLAHPRGRRDDGSAAGVAPVHRGEIWWVNFDPVQGSEIRKTRPATNSRTLTLRASGEALRRHLGVALDGEDTLKRLARRVVAAPGPERLDEARRRRRVPSAKASPAMRGVP